MAVYEAWGDRERQYRLCPECDVLLNEQAMRFMGSPGVRIEVEDYTIAVERRIGRGLYGATPLYQPPIDWDEQQRLSIAGR